MTSPDLLAKSTITPQPEFPAADLTDENAAQLSLMLQNKQLVREYHEGGESVLVFRRLHPTLEYGAEEVYDEGICVSALSHGIMVFEAVNTAVTSFRPGTIGQQALSVVVADPRTIKRIADPAETQRVSEFFKEKRPNTAEVIQASSERFFPGHVAYAMAGAALECLITSQALRIERGELLN